MSLADPPSPFRFSPRESLQSLSPERVQNRSRPASIISSKTISVIDTESQSQQPSPRSSPSRKAANLFSDYDPRRNSPVKETGFALPGSPSLPDIHAFQRSHVRTNSDVQGLVKRFEHLDVRDREAEIAERRKRHEAELRRAHVAREEAESDARRLREEVRRLKKEGEESKDRERKVAKRLDVVMDEFTTFKETQTSQHSIYEKEVRKARKEAFKSSSAVLKLQEELKSTRNSLRTTQSNLDMEKRRVQQKEQQTFDAQYQLVSLQEELDKLRTHIKTVEQEKDALKTSLKEEEVARIAAEGMIALPTGMQDDDLMSPEATRKRSPHKRQPSPFSDDKENAGIVTKKMVDLKQATEELRRERVRREQAEDLVEFLQMECRFKCCGCTSRRDSTHDTTFKSSAFAEKVEIIRNEMRSVLTPPASENGESEAIDSAVSIISTEQPEPEIKIEVEDVEMIHSEEAALEQELERSTTMTGDEFPSSDHACMDADEVVVDDEQPSTQCPSPVLPHPHRSRSTTPIASFSTSTTKVPLAPSSPQTPGLIATPARPHGSVRTITTTTTIPMQFTPAKPAPHHIDAETIPVTVMSPQRDRSGSAPAFDREAALAMIAYRRGRAKSIADGQVTPRRLEGTVNLKDRRDISAPALGQQKSSTAKRSLSKSYRGKVVGSASRTR